MSVVNDIKIYKYFYNKSLKNSDPAILKEKYINFFKLDSEYNNKADLYNRISKATDFINIVTPFSVIKENLNALLPLEQELKTEIKNLLYNELLKNEISEQSNENFEKYLSKELEYFYSESYSNDNLQIFFNALHDYNYLLSRQYFLVKLDLLNHQIALCK